MLDLNYFFTSALSQFVVTDFGLVIARPIPRDITACEQMPSALETEKSTV